MFENSNPVAFAMQFMVAIFCIVVIVVVVALGLFHTKTIKSDTLIEPEIRLKVKKNQVDTIYVYKEPKWFNKLNEER